MSVSEASRYLDLADRDYAVAAMLTGAAGKAKRDVTDWQVTLLYYVLCVEVKALAASRGLELPDHYSIKQWLNAERDLLVTAKPYRKAEEWSRDARYEGRLFTPAELSRYARWFEAVHLHVRDLLKRANIVRPDRISVATLLDLG